MFISEGAELRQRSNIWPFSAFLSWLAIPVHVQIITKKGAKFWSETKLLEIMNKNQQSKYIQVHEPCTKSRTKDNDRFKLHKLNMMKTTFCIKMHILKINNHQPVHSTWAILKRGHEKYRSELKQICPPYIFHIYCGILSSIWWCQLSEIFPQPKKNWDLSVFENM